MEKEYIPGRRHCYDCGYKDTSSGKFPQDKAFNMIGFKDKPQRWVFCEPCFLKWQGVANQMNKCPRKKIFKEVNRRAL